jgi:hypothetical protein
MVKIYYLLVIESKMQSKDPNIIQCVIADYIKWFSGMQIIPGCPLRNGFRKDFYLNNPNYGSILEFLEKYPPAHGPGQINGRGTFGKWARDEHYENIRRWKRDLYDQYILSSLMRINPNHFFSLSCLYRLNSLKNIGCMRRSKEDNISSKKVLLSMKMLGMIFFLGKRLGTSTHPTNFSIRPWIIRKFMMYVSNRMGSCGKHEYFGFQTGKIGNHYRFRFLGDKIVHYLHAYRFNFPHRFEILRDHPGKFRFATKFFQFARFVRIAHTSSHDHRLPTYVFNGKDLPLTLHQDSVAIVRSLSYMLFFKFPKKDSLFASECCMREFVRILFGFLIGTSKAKIESAVVELFAGVFPLFSSREAPECFSVFFPLFKRCESLDPKFFKQESDRMLSESIASPATNYSISSQDMEFLKIEEVKLLKLARSPIQNILLFVLYWHQKHASTWAFQFSLCSILRAIHEII